MQLRAMKCTNCGAALPPRSRWSVIDCSYCHTRLVLDGSSLVRRADYMEALRSVVERAESSGSVSIGGALYRLHGRLGRGESSDVFLAERLGPLRERVVLKIQRADDDADMLRREHETLGALSRSEAQGTPYFSALFPQVVAFGPVETRPAKPLALVHRWRSGFVETLADLASAFPEGLDARHAVWILGRILEVAGWVHQSGWVHGAILPQHALINARDHGVMLVGWSCAVRAGEPLPAVSSADEDFFTPEAARGDGVSAFTDLVMAARCAAYALTGDPRRLGAAVPRPLVELLEPYVAGDASLSASGDARGFKDALSRAAEAAFGPPKFVELSRG